MVVKLLSLMLFLGIALLRTHAQEMQPDTTTSTDDIFFLIQDKSYGGKITIYQNPSLQILVDKCTRINEINGLDGYRIQIYSGSGNTAREKATEISQEFMHYFSDFDPELIYINYQAPYFKVQVGDFRNKNEAFEFFALLKKKFSGSYIVKSKINFPKLEVPENK